MAYLYYIYINTFKRISSQTKGIENLAFFNGALRNSL